MTLKFTHRDGMVINISGIREYRHDEWNIFLFYGTEHPELISRNIIKSIEFI